MKEIKTLLLEMKGVKEVAQIDLKNREKIIDLENNYEKNGVIGLYNSGIRIVLQCDIVFAILKDTSFRPPPGPTVFMVEDQNNGNDKTDHIFKINNKKYRIIGEELIAKNPPEDEEYMYISDDFILYPERRQGRTKKPAYFLIPPIGFFELEMVKDKHKISNIISVSPSTMADDYIRELCAFSPREDYATILVGFDTA